MSINIQESILILLYHKNLFTIYFPPFIGNKQSFLKIKTDRSNLDLSIYLVIHLYYRYTKSSTLR